MSKFLTIKICLLTLSITLFSFSNDSTFNVDLIKIEASKVLSNNQEKNSTKIISILDSLIKYKISDFTPQIINLYQKDCNNYPGSQGIIRNKILRLLIITNDPKGEILFINILNNNIIGPDLETLLNYLQFYKNPSDKLIEALNNLKTKIKNLLTKTTDEKYYVYSNILSSTETCLRNFSEK